MNNIFNPEQYLPEFDQRWARLFFTLFTVAYLATLVYTYESIISSRYAYMGLRLGYYSWQEYWLGMGLAVLCCLFAPISFRRASTGLILYMMYLVVIPTCIIPFHLTRSINGKPWALILAIVFNFILLSLLCRLKPITLTPMVRGTAYAMVLLVIGGLVTVLLRFYVFSDIQLNLDLYDVYDRRYQARQASASQSLINYALNIGSSGIGLIMIAYGVSKQRYWMISFGLVLFFLTFLTIGLKGAFFRPLLVILTLIAVKLFPRYFLFMFPLGLTALCWLSIWEVEQYDTYTLSGMFVRRQLIFPAAGNTSYWLYFSNNPLYWWSDSVLRWFVRSPYPVSKSFWMGLMAGNPNLSANTNIWATAFADGGYFGMVLITIAVSFVCRLLDGFGKSLGVVFVTLIGVGIATKYSHTGFERVMISHGGLAVLVFLYLMQPIRAINRLNWNRQTSESQTDFGRYPG